MTIVTSLFLLGSFLLALMCQPLATRFRLPYPLLVVLLGFILSEILIMLEGDTGIRFDNFQWISNYLLIPILVFSSALHIQKKQLTADTATLTVLTLPVWLLSLCGTAIILYFGINHPTGFPWLAAFITAALLSATSTTTVINLLQQFQIKPRITLLLEREGLLSGILSVVTFNLLVDLATPSAMHSTHGWLGLLAWMVAGGLVVGTLAGGICIGILTLCNTGATQSLITLACVATSYIITIDLLHSSGVICVFVMGLVIGHHLRKSPQSNEVVTSTWDITKLAAITAMLLLVGIMVNLEMFSHRWLAMLIGVAAVFLSRSIAIYSCLSLLNQSRQCQATSTSDQTMLSWCGIRSDFAIALAFAIPTTLSYWWTIQSITFGVVLFSLLIQAPLIPLLTRYTASRD